MDPPAQPTSQNPSSAAEQLFFEYLRGDSADATSGFEALCAAHPELAAELREVRALYERGQQLLRGLAPEVVVEGTSTRTVSPDERYRVVAPIASGGMGAVIEVYDKKLRRTLAMKVVRPDLAPRPHESDLAHQRRRLRLLNEAQTLANLEHPSIVPIYDLGRDEQGELFFTMLRIRGISLEEVFEAARAGRDGWNARRVIDVLVRVCEAVAHAHRKNILHRDLKPANVMVGPFGEVYVMDWGLAKARGDGAASSVRVARELAGASAGLESASLTLEGDVVGTPAYMAPEQARGESRAVGPAADVYAIGAILYRWLAGCAPYSEPQRKLEPRQVLARVVAGPPEPVALLAPSAPPELAAVCALAMQRDPRERYSGVAALLDDLRAYLDERPGLAWRDSLPRRATKFVRRHPTGTIAALAVCVLAGGSALAFAQLEGLRREGQVMAATNQVLAATNREHELARALDRVRDTDPDYDDMTQREQMLAYERAALDVADALGAFGLALDPDVAQSLPAALAQCQRPDEVRAELAELSYRLVRYLGMSGLANAAEFRRGWVPSSGAPEDWHRMGVEHPRAIELWPVALELARAFDDRPLGLHALEEYVRWLLDHSRVPRFDEALFATARAEELELAAFAIDKSQGEAAAAALLERTVERFPGSGWSHFRLNRISVRAGKLETALAHGMATLAAWPSSANAHNNLGATYARMKLTDAAIKQYEIACQLDPNNATAAANLGSHYVVEERWTDALAVLERAARLEPDDADIQHYLGQALLEVGDAEADLKRIERAVAAFERALASGRDEPQTCALLGIAREQQGRQDAALEAFERGCELDPQHVDARLGRARVLWKLGRREESLDVAIALAQDRSDLAAPRDLLDGFVDQTPPGDRAALEERLREAGLD